MPELPEMETYRTYLNSTVVGKRITKVEIHREKTINVPPEIFEKRILGTTIQTVERRGKHILFFLNSGSVLLLHLMLGGWMYFGSGEDKPSNRAQVVLSFMDDMLYFCGLRLGYLHLLTPQELEHKLGKLGPEPLSPSFSEELFTSILSRKRGRLKPALVDQNVFAGIGNCYSDEICFKAGIIPSRYIQDLSPEALSHLYHSLREVLLRAISLGGYMEHPFMKDDTITGTYNDHCLVYDRGDEPCLTCGTPIIQTELAGRKMFYCPVCQH